jgi:transcriptional regulator with XRE-family HTH domain
VPGREQRIDWARVKVARDLVRIGQELHDTRLGAGLTLQEVGDAIGRSHAEMSRIEHGQSPHVPYESLALAAAAVGLDLPVKAYPAGEPIRDKGQVPLLAKLRVRLAPRLTWRTEIVLQIPGDLRAWDAGIGGPGWLVPVDAESRLHDVQAMSRRLGRKRRDSGTEVMVLLVADTRHNRSILRVAQADLAADFPLSGHKVLEALAAGRRPEASGIVVL